MTDSEWFGEPHTLTVRTVTLPDGQWDDGSLGDYDLKHPPSCKQEERDCGGGVKVTEHACELAWHERDGGLAGTLRYSGTPITEPGTYRIRSWGRKYYVFPYGYEHDGGIGVILAGEEAAT